MRSLLQALIFATFAFVSSAALAETKPVPAKPAAQAKQELKMDTVQLAALIKSTIMALQHGNQTGNYSVLRDLGTPVSASGSIRRSSPRFFQDCAAAASI